MKPTLINYFKDAFGKVGFIVYLAIYLLIVITSISYTVNGNGIVPLIVISILSISYGIIIGIDYSKYKKL